MASCQQWDSTGYSSSQDINYDVFLSDQFTVEQCADVTNGYIFLTNSEYDLLVFYADQSGQSYSAPAECYYYSNSINSGQYYVYWTDYYDLSQCDSSSSNSVVMTPSSYEILEYIGSTDSSNTDFDSEFYDLAHGSILTSWVAGLGIGMILAMVAKLKR
jgi:hypothetical protein